MTNPEEKYPHFFVPYDKEEADLMKALENEEFVSDKKSQASIKENIEMAKNTLAKKPVSLRVQSNVIDFYRRKSLKD